MTLLFSMCFAVYFYVPFIQDLFKKELAKHEKTVKLIDLNLDAQEKILSCLIDANAEFAACRREIMKQNDR